MSVGAKASANAQSRRFMNSSLLSAARLYSTRRRLGRVAVDWGTKLFSGATTIGRGCRRAGTADEHARHGWCDYRDMPRVTGLERQQAPWHLRWFYGVMRR